MSSRRFVAVVAFFLTTICGASQAQDEDEGPYSSETFDGITLRSLGPAFMSGRVADIALHPEDPNTWYVGIGSGGVWKTLLSSAYVPASGECILASEPVQDVIAKRAHVIITAEVILV